MKKKSINNTYYSYLVECYIIKRKEEKKNKK